MPRLRTNMYKHVYEHTHTHIQANPQPHAPRRRLRKHLADLSFFAGHPLRTLSLSWTASALHADWAHAEDAELDFKRPIGEVVLGIWHAIPSTNSSAACSGQTLCRFVLLTAAGSYPPWTKSAPHGTAHKRRFPCRPTSLTMSRNRPWPQQA